MRKWIMAGVIAGLVGGLLDMIAALIVYPIVYGLPIIRIPQSIASGVWGKEAYRGGAAMAATGFALHFLIAVVAGLVLAAGMRAFPVSRRRTFVSGAVFGVLMYFFMQMVVLPLSNVAVRPPDAEATFIGLVLHVLVFGVPMAAIIQFLLGRSSARA